MGIIKHTLSRTDAKLFKNLVNCEQVMINHAVIPAGDGFAAHHTDSNVFLQILRGRITLTFTDGISEYYDAGQLIEIPYQTLMKIDNLGPDPLEIVVVKAPHPDTIAKA